MRYTIVIIVLLSITSFLNSCQSESKKELDPLCTQLPKPGRCKGRIQSFFYDSNSKSCRVFFWGGCGGSRPFITKEECEARCL